MEHYPLSFPPFPAVLDRDARKTESARSGCFKDGGKSESTNTYPVSPVARIITVGLTVKILHLAQISAYPSR